MKLELTVIEAASAFAAVDCQIEALEAELPHPPNGAKFIDALKSLRQKLIDISTEEKDYAEAREVYRMVEEDETAAAERRKDDPHA